jgi:hypothetical protein
MNQQTGLKNPDHPECIARVNMRYSTQFGCFRIAQILYLLFDVVVWLITRIVIIL